MKQIPNVFTLLNLVFGCLAIVFVLQNGIVILPDQATGDELFVLPSKIWLASLFIGLAAVVDFFDGFVARLFKATSALGRQLDSLADIVSFGVAPGMIIYQFLQLSIAQEANGLNSSIIWLLPAFVLPCAAAYRLAKFNIDDSQQYSFKGVPTPAVGLLIASVPLIYWYATSPVLLSVLFNKWVWLFVIALLSYLMVSNIPMLSLKFKNFTLKDNWPKIILAAIAIIATAIFSWLAVPVIFIAYVLVSLLFKNKSV